MYSVQISLLLFGSLLSACSQNCVDCNPEDKCLRCDINSDAPLLYNGVCVQGCPPKSLQVNHECLTCHQSCQTCFGTSANQCTSCHDSEILQNGECVKPSVQSDCKQNCARCYSDKLCLECSAKMKLLNGQCISECPEQYFISYEVIDHTETNFKCIPCDSSCKTCSGQSQKDCSTCDQANPSLGVFYKGQCVAECPQGYFEQSKVCFKQIEHCILQQSTLTLCDKCKPPYLLSSGACVEECPKSEYPSNGECKTCNSNCEICNDLKTCSRCMAPYKLLNSACIQECPIGTYIGYEIQNQRQVNEKCLPCDQSCKTCSGPLDNLCVSCNQDDPLHAISLQGRCVESCPDGFVERAKVCFYCGRTCETCSNPLNPQECDTCKPGFVLHQNQCVKACPEGTFQLNGECEKCSSNCKRCKSASVCEECTAPAKLYEDKCIDTCPIGTFVNVTAIVDQRESDLKCLPCDSTCRSCSGADSDRCLSCNPNDMAHDTFLEGKCVDYCPDGYVTRAHTCFKCGDNCQSCSYLNPEECDYCYPGFVFYNSKCLTSCPEGTYNYRGKCVPCGNECKRCTSEISCQECTAPSKLYDGFCLSRCPDGTYVNATIVDHYFQDQKCLPCDPTCRTCSGPEKDRCSSCNQADPLHDISLEGKCVDSCPAGFVERSKVCFYCGENCATCSNPLDPKECDTCKPGFLLNGKQCVQKCPKGTFQQGQQCRPCSADCLQCNSLTECTECKAPSKLFEGSCIQECPSKTYLNYTIVDRYESDLKCLACDRTCNSCSGPELNQCLSCNPKERAHDTMLEGKCVARCPQGYLERAKTCFPCDITCQSCSNPDDLTQCDSCKFGYILYQSHCISGCPIGTYETRNSCKPCAQNCDKCISEHVCEECAAPFSLFKDECLRQCPTKYFTNATKIVNHREADLRCIPCDPTCHNCSNQEINGCLTCDKHSREHDTFLQGKCVDTCPTEFYIQNPYAMVCMHCGPNCKTCNDFLNPQKCQSCVDGFLMNIDEKCVATCPSGTYQEDSACKLCEANCATCNSATECTSCTNNYELLNADCVLNCPVGTFEDNNVCLDCPASCTSCSSLTECSTCAESYYFLNNFCVDSCPDGTFQENNECKCKYLFTQECLQNCLTCSSATTCLSCDQMNSQHDTLFQGQCLDSCPNIPGVFQIGEHECKICPQQVTQIHHSFVLEALQNCDISIDTAQDLSYIAKRIEQYYDSFVSYFVLQTQSLWQNQAESLIESTRNLLKQANVADVVYEGDQLSLSKSKLASFSLSNSFAVGSSVQMQIQIPQSAISDLSEAHLGSSCFVSGVYSDSSIGQYQIPLCDISILSGGKIQKIQNLNQEIKIKHTFEKLPQNQGLSCAYWDSNTESFITTGITTLRNQNQISCSTPHLSSFQIIPSDLAVYSNQDLSSVLIVGCTLGFCAFLLIMALFTDFACLRRKQLPYYPHLETQNTKSFCFIFKYSFLYNFPVVSLFSFQEPSIRAYSRAFWFTDLLIMMLNIIGLLFSNEILKCDPNTANQLIISFCLGLCLIPGSFIINLLAIKVRKATSKEDTQIFLAASVVNSTNQTRFIQRKCGIIFLAIATVCVYVLGLLNLYFLQLTDSFLVTFAIAVAAGCVFSLVKITLSSVVAYKYHHNPGFLFNLFVDVLTDMVTFRARQGNADVTFSSSQPSRLTFNN